MLAAVRRGVVSIDLDERHMSFLLAGASPWSATAALGHVIGEVSRGMARDRRLMRIWLSSAEEAPA